MKKIRSFFKVNRALVIAVLFLITTAIAVWLFFRPSAPKRPSDLASGDFSYAVEYSDYQIQAAMKKYNIPGVIFAMIDGEDVIFSKSYGYSNLDKNTVTTADTIFKAGSISKVFTGIEVMKMQEEGKIDISNPLADYLPEFKINNRFTESESITVESILTHRSGLPRGSSLFLWDWSNRPLVLGAQMKSLHESYTVYPVGYRYKYSNIGYNVLGRMIERVNNLNPPSDNTAGAFPYYMQDNFFIPLGMNSTSFGSSMLMYGTPSANPSAMGYYREKGKNIPINQFDIISMASGNVHTTLNDMITFTKMLLTADDGLITRNLLDTMYYHQDYDQNDLKDNGLTWFRNSDILGETVVFHDGTNQGFISMLAMIPEQNLGMVIIANSEEFENVKSVLSFDILRVMLESKSGSTLPERSEPETVSISEDLLKTFTGKYLINNEVIEVVFKKGKLKAKYMGFALSLKPIGENLFTFNNPLGNSVESRISFFPGNEFDRPYMILEMGDVFFCPRYPVPEDIPDSWAALVGNYNRKFKHPSEYSTDEDISTIEIQINDGILMFGDSFAVIPYSDDKLLIQGGIFHGETMEYDSDSGLITWQHLVYEPLE